MIPLLFHPRTALHLRFRLFAERSLGILSKAVSLIPLLALLFLWTPSASAVTLDELRADGKLTPERLIKYFADFKFKLGRAVLKPEVFLAAKAGDCDDFASLAAGLLREKGYTPRLVAVFMPHEVHVVCYIKETKNYLDYNCRKQASPLVKSGEDLSAIATNVAASFRAPWLSASEFTLQPDGTRHFLLTEFH